MTGEFAPDQAVLDGLLRELVQELAPSQGERPSRALSLALRIKALAPCALSEDGPFHRASAWVWRYVSRDGANIIACHVPGSETRNPAPSPASNIGTLTIQFDRSIVQSWGNADYDLAGYAMSDAILGEPRHADLAQYGIRIVSTDAPAIHNPTSPLPPDTQSRIIQAVAEAIEGSVIDGECFWDAEDAAIAALIALRDATESIQTKDEITRILGDGE